MKYSHPSVTGGDMFFFDDLVVVPICALDDPDTCADIAAAWHHALGLPDTPADQAAVLHCLVLLRAQHRLREVGQRPTLH